MFKTIDEGGLNEYVCFTNYGMAMVQSTSPLASKEVAKAWDEYRKSSGEYAMLIDEVGKRGSLCIGKMK